MKRKFLVSYILLIIMLSSSIMFLSSCSNDTTPSLYSPTAPTGDAPEIISVEPENRAIAAVTPITITGKNFVPDTTATKVYFGNQYAKILSITPTELVVISPNLKGEMNIRISTKEAEPFSNEYIYTLEPATIDLYPEEYDADKIPFAITVDNSETLYSSNSLVGVVTVAQDGSSELYSPRGGETYLTSMRFGRDDTLFVARGLYAIFYIPPGGGVKNAPWIVLDPKSIRISKIEFDPMGNLWAAGANDAIYRIKPDKSYTSFPFEYEVTAMRIFVENSTTYLYVAAKITETNTKIFRMEINSEGELGASEEYFDFSGNYESDFEVNDITFAADGEMFLATDLPSSIVYVKPDKSTDYLYQGILLKSPALSIAWGTGDYLYYVRSEITDDAGETVVPQTIVKVNMMKQGAEYYER